MNDTERLRQSFEEFGRYLSTSDNNGKANSLKNYMSYSKEIFACRTILAKYFTFLENEYAVRNAGYEMYKIGHYKTHGFMSFKYDIGYNSLSISNYMHNYISVEMIIHSVVHGEYSLQCVLYGDIMMEYLIRYLKAYYPEECVNPSLYIANILDHIDKQRLIFNIDVGTENYNPIDIYKITPIDVITHAEPKVRYTSLFPFISIFTVGTEVSRQEFTMNNIKLFNILIEGIMNGVNNG